jgi:hypothetical protein
LMSRFPGDWCMGAYKGQFVSLFFFGLFHFQRWYNKNNGKPLSNAEFIFGALRAWFLNPLWNLLLVNMSTLSLFCVSSSHLHGPNIFLLLDRWCWTKHFSALSIFCRKYLSFVLI